MLMVSHSSLFNSFFLSFFFVSITFYDSFSYCVSPIHSFYSFSYFQMYLFLHLNVYILINFNCHHFFSSYRISYSYRIPHLFFGGFFFVILYLKMIICIFLTSYILERWENFVLFLASHCFSISFSFIAYYILDSRIIEKNKTDTF